MLFVEVCNRPTILAVKEVYTKTKVMKIKKTKTLEEYILASTVDPIWQIADTVKRTVSVKTVFVSLSSILSSNLIRI